MICDACGTQNPDNSKFCIYCGVALIEEKINLEMEVLKTKRHIEATFIEKEMAKWQTDPMYVPMLGSPAGIKQPTINPIDEKIKAISEETWGFNNPKEYGLLTNVKQIKKAKEHRGPMPLGTTQEIFLCGICGTVDCEFEHIPSIQQQYQEAFENIQKFRRKRYNRAVWGVDFSGKIEYHDLLSERRGSRPMKMNYVK